MTHTAIDTDTDLNAGTPFELENQFVDEISFGPASVALDEFLRETKLSLAVEGATATRSPASTPLD